MGEDDFKNYDEIPSIPNSGLILFFFLLIDLGKRVRIRIQENRNGKDSFKLDVEIVDKTDKLLEYKCNISTQHWNNSILFRLGN